MYTVIKNLSAQQITTALAPSFFVSLFVAQMWYKFGAFLPELIAFLVTWFALDWLLSNILRRKSD